MILSTSRQSIIDSMKKNSFEEFQALVLFAFDYINIYKSKW